MVSKCANPSCDQLFRYLRKGTVFFLERTPSSKRVGGSVEHFWLCDECSETLTLRFDMEQRPQIVRNQVREKTKAVDVARREDRLLEALRFELQFLSQDGYRTSDHWSFVEPSFLEDSPICPNRNRASKAVACRDCPLATLIPSEKLDTPRACHFIPLRPDGATLFDLYQAGVSTVRIESILRKWLEDQVNNAA